MSTIYEQYAELKNADVKLDITRGKPSPKQLDLSRELLTILSEDEYRDEQGFDCRNYGKNAGLDEVRRLYSNILDLPIEQVLVPAPASLELMYDTVLYAMVEPVITGGTPWLKQAEKPVWLCPVPGYDRHFSITESLGIEMVPITMTKDGPCLHEIEEALVKYGERIKGMWNVPVYSNPTGYTYSEQVLRKLLSLPFASDCRLLFDLAYIEHHLYPHIQKETIPNIVNLAKEIGKPDIAIVFASMSKITFPGSSTACIASSPANIKWYKKHLAARQIGTNKICQLRHSKLFPTLEGLREHMCRQADILRPKFEIVQEIFSQELADLPNVSWTTPKGGYFIGLSLPNNTANRVVELAAEVGVKITPAGSPYPYGKNPADNFLRIAPSFPPEDELKQAADAIALCVKIACAELEK